MADLFAVLKAGKTRVKVIKFPGTEEDIGITVLTENEMQEASFAAEALFKSKEIEVKAATVQAYASELNSQMLYRALVNPAKRGADGLCERFFKSAEELKSLLNRGVKDILVSEYNAFEDETNPEILNLTDENLALLGETVKKRPDFLNSLSFRTLSLLTVYLVSRHVTSPGDSGCTSH